MSPALTAATATDAGPATASPNPAAHAARLRSSSLEQAIEADPRAFRILSGDRPTGSLHIGHYFGTLQNRVQLQDAGADLLVLIADYQAITDRTGQAGLRGIVLSMMADYLAIGVDPAMSTIFAHSQVPELNQLLPFLALVSVAEIGRNPTVKDEISAAGQAGMNGLMFTYPVHQAADILFCHANLVPVGKDQLPHLEITRTIARRFNERYAAGAPNFPEPDALLSTAPLLLGLDGTKMGKSRRNAVALAATADQTAALIRSARTDPERQITYDPDRRPEVASLLTIAALCRGETPQLIAAEIGAGGAAALKTVATEAVNEFFAPIRARRAALAADPGYLRSVLADGSERARGLAADTLAAVRGLMHQHY